MTVSDDWGHHVTVYGDSECAGRWCLEHDHWHIDPEEDES
jgi:hypothetical protein